jgi:ABC-type glutathione transport system ATPase component
MKPDVSLANASAMPVLRVRGLNKRYVRKSVMWRKSERIAAASEISFDLHARETLALVGRSGSGKSTIARCVTRIEKPDSGEIWLDGVNIASLSGRSLREARTKIQMVFQDPTTSMNPRFSACEVVEEPMLLAGTLDRAKRRARVQRLMQDVGLSADWIDRPAMDFSGGQRQRLAIARAIAANPRVLVLDEALTGLDLSTEAQIANLLLDLQEAHELAYLLISHDLELVSSVADSVALMKNGRIVEQGLTEQVLSHPAHTETRALLAATRQAQTDLALALGVSS